MNDTTREVGGTLGVAVLGSIMATLYGGKVVDALRGSGLPVAFRQTAGDSLAAALQIASRVGGTAGAGSRGRRRTRSSTRSRSDRW